MKFVCSMFALGLLASASFAQDNVVQWRQVVGVLTAPGVDNPVGGTVDANGNGTNQIHSGTAPWTTKGGSAHIDLRTGDGAFHVEGLVLNGGNATGTPGPITSVVGTLLCNPGSTAAPVQSIIDTPPVTLTAMGNAALSFKLTNIPATCNSPLFLIRIPQFGLRWIATAALPVSSLRSEF